MLFFLFESLNFFFDCADGQKTININGFGLADAVSAIYRLVFYARIPPWIEDDHRIGGRQIQSCAAGFQADKKHGDCRIGIEFFYESLAVFCLAGKI